MIKKILLFLLVICSFNGLYGQQKDESKSNSSSVSVALEPAFFAINGAKFAVEIQKKGKSFAYVITPEIYGGYVKDVTPTQNQVGVSDDRLNGFGIGLLQKYKKKNQIGGPYLAYGVTYRYHSIAYNSDVFKPYQENGLTYYEYGPIKDVIKINSFLISSSLGYQVISSDILFDFYTGFGYKIPSMNSAFPEARKYDQNFHSYGYNGVVLLVGVKLGFQIKK